MKWTEKNKQQLYILARLVLGLVFIVSGFVKAVDPLGTAYKLDDYLGAFGWTFLNGMSFLFSILLSGFEFFMGICLVLGVFKRTIPLLALLFMLFMAPLTFYIALTNPVTDCGCFGDAFVLSNVSTFIKNLVLLALAVFVYLRTDYAYQLFGKNTSFWVAVWCAFFPLFVSSYSALHIPMLDFRPYKVGNHLPDLMKTAFGSEADSVQTLFVYQKDGIKKTFALENAPVEDTTWTFVDRIEKIITKGKEPIIHGLALTTKNGDVTTKILNDTSYVFLLIAPKLEEMNYSRMLQILNAKAFADKHGYRFLGLTSSNSSIIDDWRFEYDETFEFASVDNITLKTMIRSNPGLILLKNGTVIQKWGYRDIPDFSYSEKLDQTELGFVQKNKELKMLAGLILLFLTPLIFLFLIHHGYRVTFPWQKNTIN